MKLLYIAGFLALVSLVASDAGLQAGPKYKHLSANQRSNRTLVGNAANAPPRHDIRNISARGFDPNNPPPPEVIQEPASEELWARCRNKGCSLTEAMRMSDLEAGQRFLSKDTAASPWTEPMIEETWGYQTRWQWDGTYGYEKFDNGHDWPQMGWGIGDSLRGLGVSDKIVENGGTVELYSVNHGNYDDDWTGRVPYELQPAYEVKEKGRWYRVTGGKFQFAVDPHNGVILAMDRHSPKNAAKDRRPPIPVTGLPELNQFSDIAWLFWMYSTTNAQTDMTKIRYFFSLSITNKETQAVIHRAVQPESPTIKSWPGHTFDWDTMAFRAILGTPNGQGFGYFLMQHKPQLGNMFINKVQVFASDNHFRLPSLVFHVGPVPPPRPNRPRPPPADVEKRTEIDISNPIFEMQGENRMKRSHIMRPAIMV
ncbi:hypothetical protein P280DRAFT_511031 [Massarina eburnea CBS 473.64]|uniref:Concanavalin A-like lectin/glucanase n=1 Tax=Massarina eburnea CBS 473.64 TaxID=1395130 RepID=A0A6A6RK75_9PLEO|nr:hypothetical protein P280DRAFT_511031 [Massarina eburnea CBS 473.64]